MTDRRHLLAALLAVLVSSSAFAGGPLLIFDPGTRTPYTWPGGNPAVYTDLGTLGQLTNEQADAMFAFSVQQWNDVPTSSFAATNAGDFATIGLPDIDAGNFTTVLGPWNGGGIHVIYDADGSIMTEIFGSPYGVLGVTILEWVDEDHPNLAEVTMVLNGLAVPEDWWATAEEAAAMYAGVTTHELGHAIGLAHSQTNGQLVFFYDVSNGPAACATPYAAAPTPADIETMYPFTNLGSTGIPESTVDILDDIATVSDLYPAHAWPRSRPSIAGTIKALASSSGLVGTPPGGNHATTDEATTATPAQPGGDAQMSGRRRQPASWKPHPHGRQSQVPGANVIARNVANPYRDAVSAITGDYTQGLIRADGTYHLHGLTPGASYVVYVDGLLYGAFATPSPTVLPGPEEYWNGRQESGDGESDDRCQWRTVRPRSGRDTIIDVTFNRVKGAPEFIPIDLPSSTITELSRDGKKGVGAWEGGILRWSPAGVELLQGGSRFSPQAGISHDGNTITASVEDENGLVNAAIYRDGQGFRMIAPGPNSASCDTSLTSGWGVANDGTVVGLDWYGCNETSAFRYKDGVGFTDLGSLGPGLPSSRANRISADASTVVGWDRDDTGFWRGAAWRGGQETLFTQAPALCCDFDPAFCTVSNVGTANAVNPDGSLIVGEYLALPQTFTDPDSGEVFHYCTNTSWRWTPGGGVQSLGEFPGYTPIATDVSDDGKVIVGLGQPDDFFAPRRATIWTQWTGFLDFQEFLQRQGTWANDWNLAVAGTVSGDGKTVGGFGFSPLSIQGFVVKMPKVIVCHTSGGHRPRKQTIDVPWPEGLPSHLAHGDTIGMCANGQ